MNRTKQIINKTLSIIGVLFLAGCETNKPDWGKYRGTTNELQTINPVEHYSSSNTTSYDPITSPLYQAYDPQYPGLPQISPVFVTELEAFKYASSNNFSGDQQSGHKYIVREVDYRYEVRHQNDAVNDVIFTSLTLEESEKYLNEYKTNHTDLVIFDLMDSVVVGVNTP